MKGKQTRRRLANSRRMRNDREQGGTRNNRQEHKGKVRRDRHKLVREVHERIGDRKAARRDKE